MLLHRRMPGRGMGNVRQITTTAALHSQVRAVASLQKRLSDLAEDPSWMSDSINLDPRVLIRYCRARKLDLASAGTSSPPVTPLVPLTRSPRPP